MTENQPVDTPTPMTTSIMDSIKGFVGKILSSWTVRITLLAIVLLGVGIFAFFWQHYVAELGMKMWTNSSGARPIECVLKDTNNDNYVSCSALLGDQVVPLECSSSLFNLGCRVNYGSAVPNVKASRGN
ncbi:conserved hypothetical protein [Planktothrix serta PCC 8927]|uniref:Uncharacterized protein n=1 Tax=Planktothrix serta PCC 8927 TaxID=671068 RepID=A0A7Z9BL80_9CYAN|nr:hypothetical protein [Planktothrix serta]VXD15116.1 conserved hypothetical protein [Planktothrix serta PCC 8927]